ncbi:hypothetical protein E1B06_15070 [Brevibacillus laterosporus]|uniref:hypothetical protein n=1 Tax=Brevibacillus laterosporus TaxID=1465 RepID=UPI002404B719|nr:hypothetical protein [Brevibacillus laterosporus]MDF9413005.1 hypothetical protein [Brevibacillus laterosporus]
MIGTIAFCSESFRLLEKEVVGIESIVHTEQPHENSVSFTLTGTEEACKTVQTLIEKSRPVGTKIDFNFKN